VIIGQRAGSANYELAISTASSRLAPKKPPARRPDQYPLPDEVQATSIDSTSSRISSPATMLMCSHGFNVHFGQVEAPAGVDTCARRPKGPGTWCGANRARRR